jgi:hypothetical protein
MWDWSLRKRCLWGVRLAFRCHSILSAHRLPTSPSREWPFSTLAVLFHLFVLFLSRNVCSILSLSLFSTACFVPTPLLFLISSSLFKNLYSFDPCSSSPNPRVVFPVQHHDWWCFRWWIHDLPLSFNLYIWSDEPCK